jgi:hypothetical protein
MTTCARVRPLFAVSLTFQRTVYRPGEICQFDLWEPAAAVPVGHGQTRKGYVVVACLGYAARGVSTPIAIIAPFSSLGTDAGDAGAAGQSCVE